MKLYIVADMEGVAGVVAEEQVNDPKAWDSDRVRRQFTEEVSAVCQAALDAGVEEVVVNDFHGSGRNLLVEKLPKSVFVIQGDFRSTSGFDFLDNSYGGLVLLGAHARTGSMETLLPHTYTNQVQFELFGQPVGEFDILSFLAGESKIPTILISGDSKMLEQARTNLPSTHMVVTKFAIGSNAALCFHPANVLESLVDETKRAVKNVANIEPPQIGTPVQMKIRVASVQLGERIEWIPQLKRLDDLAFEFEGENMRQIAKVIFGITILAESTR